MKTAKKTPELFDFKSFLRQTNCCSSY